MVHRIKAQNSIYIVGSDAFANSGPDTTLIVDADAFLIANDGTGAKLVGSWIVNINGVVGGFDDSIGLRISDSLSSKITIGRTGHLFGEQALVLQGAGTIINNGVMSCDSLFGGGAVVSLHMAGN